MTPGASSVNLFFLFHTKHDGSHPLLNKQFSHDFELLGAAGYGEAGTSRDGKANDGDLLQYTLDGKLAKPTKLSLVVKDAVKRWYLETEKEAQRGDVVGLLLFSSLA